MTKSTNPKKDHERISTDFNRCNVSDNWHRLLQVEMCRLYRMFYQNGDSVLHGNDNSKYNLFVSWM